MQTNNHSQRVGTRLLQALNSRNLTKRDLARRLGCDENTVARMANGQDRMSISLLSEAMRAMEYQPAQLFDESDLKQ